jgi:hypothetical protein
MRLLRRLRKPHRPTPAYTGEPDPHAYRRAYYRRARQGQRDPAIWAVPAVGGATAVGEAGGDGGGGFWDGGSFGGGDGGGGGGRRGLRRRRRLTGPE